MSRWLRLLDGREVEVQTVPIRCKLLGHQWHNEQGWNTFIPYDEPCERRDCPATRDILPRGVYANATTYQATVLQHEYAPQLAHAANQIFQSRFKRDGHADSFYAGVMFSAELVKNLGVAGPDEHKE